MARLNPPVLITANALAGGEVIYLTEQQTWSPWINEGFIFNDLDTANTVMVARARGCGSLSDERARGQRTEQRTGLPRKFSQPGSNELLAR